MEASRTPYSLFNEARRARRAALEELEPKIIRSSDVQRIERVLVWTNLREQPTVYDQDVRLVYSRGRINRIHYVRGGESVTATYRRDLTRMEVCIKIPKTAIPEISQN